MKYLTQEEIIEKLKMGVTLFKFSTFMKPGSSLKSKVTNKNYYSYRFSDGGQIHQMTAKSMLKKGILKTDPSSSERTIGGSKIKLTLS